MQREIDSAETEMTSQQLWALFESTYLAIDLDLAYHGHHLFEEGDKQGIEIEMTVVATATTCAAWAPAPSPPRSTHWACRSASTTTRNARCAPVPTRRRWPLSKPRATAVNGIRYGAGRHANIATASVLAVLSAARRLGVSAKDLKVLR